jgi:flagellar basal body rod protein FlgB
MDPTQMSVFSLMKARLQMLGERQKVIAQNVANVSTPGYVPGDINQDAFAATLQRMAGRGGGAAGCGTHRHGRHAGRPHAAPRRRFVRAGRLHRQIALTPKPRSTATPSWSKSR